MRKGTADTDRTAGYDEIADEYARQFEEGMPPPDGVMEVALRALLAVLGPTAGLEVCDLGCGEGTLARLLARAGARVTGIDVSARLLVIARQRTPDKRVRYVQDDARALATQTDGAFDRVVSNLALMDVPDLGAVYDAVHRVLGPVGRFVFSITHPCFQSPGTSVETDAGGNFVARRIRRYHEEGFWRSDGERTIRSRMGAHHRTLSTYVNRLLERGFALRGLTEPTLPPGSYATAASQGMVHVPSVLVIDAYRE